MLMQEFFGDKVEVLLYSIDLKIGTNQHKGINGKRDYPPCCINGNFK